MSDTLDAGTKEPTPETQTVTDARGRVLKVRALTILEEMNLLEAAGDLSDNRRWYSLATLAAMVRRIDEMPAPFPNNKLQIKGAVSRVGGDGVAAVAKLLTPPEDAGEGAAPGEAQAAA